VITEVELPEYVDVAAVEQLIEELASAAGLQIGLRGTLKQYPGSRHWHFQRRRTPGTLELTVWPQQRRVWFAIRQNRWADWIDEALSQMRSQLEAKLQSR
jgi:hypothetical protein